MSDFVFGYVMGSKAASRAASLTGSAGASDSARPVIDPADLEAQIDRLVLVVDAMWMLLKTHGYADEQLATQIRKLTAEDGNVDGDRSLRPIRCAKCESMVEPGRSTCTYCGAAIGGTGRIGRA